MGWGGVRRYQCGDYALRRFWAQGHRGGGVYATGAIDRVGTPCRNALSTHATSVDLAERRILLCNNKLCRWGVSLIGFGGWDAATEQKVKNEARRKSYLNRYAPCSTRIFYILLMVGICGAGCVSPTPVLDPLAGWKVLLSHDSQLLDKAIYEDYQGYIQKLPLGDRKFSAVALVNMFKDATGQHAVKIEIPVDGIIWEHVLIYDNGNKRTNLIKYYKGGRYAKLNMKPPIKYLILIGIVILIGSGLCSLLVAFCIHIRPTDLARFRVECLMQSRAHQSKGRKFV